jgi:hypothetical protein
MTKYPYFAPPAVDILFTSGGAFYLKEEFQGFCTFTPEKGPQKSKNPGISHCHFTAKK